MRDLIIAALNDAFSILDSKVPSTKKKYVDVRIDDIKPTELLKYMKDNNIPDCAEFDVDDNSKPILTYEITVPTTEKDKLEIKKKMFDNIAFSSISKTLTENGYYRTSFSSNLLSKFRNDSRYDLYLAKDYDRLVEYYSLYYKK